MTARFTHDCDQCKPLGQFMKYDLYYCDGCSGREETVVARFGDEGWAYISGIDHTIEPAIRMAKLMAVEAGYIKRESIHEQTN